MSGFGPQLVVSHPGAVPVQDGKRSPCHPRYARLLRLIFEPDPHRTPLVTSSPRGTVATSPTSIASPRIVRIKRFSMTPMFEEDAIARMTELGHAFFVFLNAETDRIGVVYARHDGSFGLIDPVTGEA